MNPPAKLSDLLIALEGPSDEYCTRFDRQTGRIVSVEESILRAVEDGNAEGLEGLAGWQQPEVETARAICEDSGGRFLKAPDPFDFHEYRQMERFIGSLADERAAEELWRAIKGKGAFRHFKDTAARLGLLDRWYRHRDEAMRQFVIGWAEANGVPFEDDEPKAKPAD